VTASVESAPVRTPQARGKSTLSDTLVVTWRNLKRIPRIPELAAFAILQSVMFVLLFAYVFGGAIPLPNGENYKEFLMPGIFAQTLAFASATTTVGITDDMQKGLVDRYRSLPMARSAFLTGRTVADVVYNLGILIVLMLSGLVVGWRVRDGVVNFFIAIALALLFTYAMSWLGVFVGQLVPTVEVAQQVAFTTIFPITFLSSVFVPIETLPGWLQPIAEWNPVTTLTASMRDLFGNPNPYPGDGFPAEYPILVTVLWSIVFVAVFAPLAVRRYRDTSR
jgi:ABC-2 type transport system permease protein